MAEKKETLKSNIKQIAALEEQETHLLIDYEIRKLIIYTNKATIINRLARLGYMHTKQDTVDGQIYSRTYEFDTNDIKRFLKNSIFKYD
jgi:hypothetical protein